MSSFKFKRFTPELFKIRLLSKHSEILTSAHFYRSVKFFTLHSKRLTRLPPAKIVSILGWIKKKKLKKLVPFQKQYLSFHFHSKHIDTSIYFVSHPLTFFTPKKLHTPIWEAALCNVSRSLPFPLHIRRRDCISSALL